MRRLLARMIATVKLAFFERAGQGLNCIYVVGNSHTRAFSYNANFFPMFLGSGKTHSLINDMGLESLKKSLNIALSNIENQRVMLVLGEPDARYCLGKGWYPWEGKTEFQVEDFRPLIDASFSRYKQLISYLRSTFNNTYMILNVTPVADSQENEIVRYFNELLRSFCIAEGLIFIDINEKFFLKDGVVNPDYLGDSIHLNNRIQPLVEDFLIDKKVLKSSHFEHLIDWDHVAIQANYKYNKKFGCYVIHQE